MRPVDREVDRLEQRGLERCVGKESQRIARHGAVVTGTFQRVGERAMAVDQGLRLRQVAVALVELLDGAFQNSRSMVRPRRNARITGRVILPSRKSSPTDLPS